ncbi:biotin--[acetyl-CoA-carboxylase] ligase [Eubacteriales bacterium OttesenSCG-928-N13]|nr:biotin--[acetyl-CoA-carboxylase] ligase [Eubacteriales bacterium OttesenSCG-928-N13]
MNPLMSDALRARGAVYFDVVDSTNIVAKQLARQGAADKSLVLSDEQTAGRGRRGRGWISSPGQGAWMSLIVRPDVPVARAPELVMVSAVALCRAISDVCGLDLSIKWPNDMLANGKKLCGTLLEISASEDRLDWAVIGIGVNILGTKFPPELPDAGSIESVSGKRPRRAAVVEAFLNAFDEVYAHWQNSGMGWLLPIYKAHCSTLGARVRAICPDGEHEGVAEDISPDGALMLRLSDGSLRALYAGDVSVRGTDRYG